MRTSLLLILSLICVADLLAQAPSIQKVEPISTYPNNSVVITGSGFSNNAADLQVWFDQVEGTITSASEYAIVATVPAQARLNMVEVINLNSRLSAKSNLKFMPSYNGTTFDPLKFTAPLAFNAPEELWDICSCDFDDDGKPDMAATKFATTASTDLMVLENTSTPGNLAFTKWDKSNLPVLNLTFASDGVVCGDLQGDGKPDMIVARAGSPRNSIHIFRNTSAAGVISFAANISLFLDVGHFATRITIRDLNKDGKPELIVTNSFNDVIYIFINQSASGTLSFNTTPIKMSIKIASSDVLTTYEAELQDLNGDNLPEIIVNQFQTGNDLYIFRNQSSGAISFAAPQKITLGSGSNRINSADFNNDGRLDLVITSTVNNRLFVLMNQSSGNTFSFTPLAPLVTSLGPWGLDVSDIEGDGDPDIIVANRNESFVNIFTHNGNFSSPSFTRSNIATSNTTRNIKAGDLDGDGKPDLAFTSFNSGTSTYKLEVMRNTNCHKPKILNEGPLNICLGQTIRLNTIPANNVTFAWDKDSSPKGGNLPYLDIVYADGAGVYRVTATGESGACAVSSTITVTTGSGGAPADPTITSNSPLCSTSNLQLNTPAVGGATYNWTGPGGYTSTAQNPLINNVTTQHAGIYSLQVDVGGCRSNVATTRVDVADLADFALISNKTATICQGDNGLNLSINNIPNHTYQWKRDGSNIVPTTPTTLNGVTTEGSYTVVVQNTVLGCSKETAPLVVTILTPPTAAYQMPATACVNQQVSFTNQSIADPRATVVYNWNFGNGTSTSVNPTNTYSTAQTFNTSLNVSYSGIVGCSNAVNKNISIISGTQPVINSTLSSICAGEETTLSVTGSFNTITWSNSSTGASITVNQPGTFSVTTVDGNGCSATDDIVIASKPVPVIEVSADAQTIPPGGTVQLTATGADTYSWSPVGSLDNPSISNPKATPTETTLYTVTGTLTAGCSSTATINITVDGSVIVIKVPVAFSPNGDGENETLIIEGSENYPDCTLAIFDGRGRRVHEQKGNGIWDGNYQGKPVPEGTYYFVFGCPDKKPVTGSVLIFK